MKTKIQNPWKVASIVLGIIVVSLAFISSYQNERKDNLDVDGVKIDKESFCKFYNANVIEINKEFQLCDMKNKICSRKLKLQKDICSK